MNDVSIRRSALNLMARSPATLLAERFASLGEMPNFTWLRRPETGMVMLRARIGGDGGQFNLGEATLTRCTLRLDDGTVGVGTVRGRSAQQAEMIALCDAMLQQTQHAARVHSQVIAALEAAEQSRQQARAAEVAASRVDFFTLARGDNA